MIISILDGKELKDVKAPAENIAGNIDMAMVSGSLKYLLFLHPILIDPE